MARQEDFFLALRTGNLDALETLAQYDMSKRGNLLNGNYWEEGTVLHIAAAYGHEHIIKWILSSGGGRALGFFNVLARTPTGLTALHEAVVYGNLQCCKMIASRCTDVLGEREEMMNAVTYQGNTVLHLTSTFRYELIIPWLLSDEEGGGRVLGFKSESVTALNEDSKSVLHIAALEGSAESIEILLSKCTSEERMRLFRTVTAPDGWTALHWAAQRGQAALIRQLLCWEEASVMVDIRDSCGMTVLHRLVCNGAFNADRRIEWEMNMFRHEVLFRALLGLDLEAVQTTTTTRAVAVGFVDVNAGLHMPT